jgi:hypothetical protein
LALLWRKERSKQKHNWYLQHSYTPQINIIIGTAYWKLCDFSFIRSESNTDLKLN